MNVIRALFSPLLLAREGQGRVGGRGGVVGGGGARSGLGRETYKSPFPFPDVPHFDTVGGAFPRVKASNSLIRADFAPLGARAMAAQKHEVASS